MKVSCVNNFQDALSLSQVADIPVEDVNITHWRTTTRGVLTVPGPAGGSLSDWCPESCYSRCAHNRLVLRLSTNATDTREADPATQGRCGGGRGHATAAACHAHGVCADGRVDVRRETCALVGRCTNGDYPTTQGACERARLGCYIQGGFRLLLI